MLKRKNISNTSTKSSKSNKSIKHEQKSSPQSQDPKTSAFPNTLYPQIHTKISSYLQDYQKLVISKSHKLIGKSFIIQGPPGSGKTHFVRQLATDSKLTLLEINVSSVRSRANILKLLREATQSFSIDKGINSGTVIFIDDIDIVLEPDQGFYKGIEVIISDNKCPVLMTCQEIPKVIQGLSAVIYSLDSHGNHRDLLLKKLAIERIPSLNPTQIKNLIVKAKSDINVISNNLLKNVLTKQDLASLYGTDVLIQSELTFKVLKAEGFFEELWNHFSVSVSEPDLLSPFHDNLCVLDLLETGLKSEEKGFFKIGDLYSGIEKLFLKHREAEEEFLLRKEDRNKDIFKIIRENLAITGSTEDYFSFLQMIKDSPTVYSSYQLRRRQNKN